MILKNKYAKIKRIIKVKELVMNKNTLTKIMALVLAGLFVLSTVAGIIYSLTM